MTSNATLAPLNPSTAPSNSTIAPTHAAAALSHTQDVIIESIERVGAGISVPCVVFLIWTFLAYQRLRTPSNTLLFNASPANLFAGIASLIGRAGLSRPNAATCQIQGLFLEWFMQADPYWVCAGAVNVMLVFFFRFNAEQLRRLNLYYWIICYGVPAIPAIFSLIYKKNGKHMYGDATLWCWYDSNYVLVRLYAYYIPIWLVVSFAMLMYILVGIKIHRNNVLLHSIQSTPLSNTNICSRTFSHHVTYEPIPTPPPSHSSSSNTNKYPVSTVTISAAPGPSSGSCAVLRSMFLSFQHLFGDDSNLSPSDRTTLAYSRVAFLFFASNLITWVPASINRVYAIQHPATPSFFLNVFAAIVLPLQGLWNCIIYLVVNKAVLKVMFVEWNVKLRGLKKKRSGAGAVVDSGGDGRNIGVDQGRSESTELDDDKMQDLRKALRFY